MVPDICTQTPWGVGGAAASKADAPFGVSVVLAITHLPEKRFHLTAPSGMQQEIINVESLAPQTQLFSVLRGRTASASNAWPPSEGGAGGGRAVPCRAKLSTLYGMSLLFGKKQVTNTGYSELGFKETFSQK